MTDNLSYPNKSAISGDAETTTDALSNAQAGFGDPPTASEPPRTYGTLRLFANRRARNGVTDQITQQDDPTATAFSTWQNEPQIAQGATNGTHPTTNGNSNSAHSPNQPEPVPYTNNTQVSASQEIQPRRLTGPLPNAAPTQFVPIVPDHPLMSGMLGAFSTSALLSLMNIQKQTGALRLVSGRSAGQIYVDRGEVVDAILGVQRGAMALFQMFAWTSGEFYFINATTDRRTIEASLPVLQVRATLWLDNLRQYHTVIPTTEHRIQIHPEPRGDVIIESHQWGVLTKIVGGPKSISQLAAELGDVDVMAVIRIAADLVRMGVAVVLPPADG